MDQYANMTEAQPQSPQMARLTEFAELVNIADGMAEDELGKIGNTACLEYRIDLDSRKDWEDTARRATELIESKKGEKSYPFQGAADIKYPLLTIATLQFAARAAPAILQGPNVVRCAVKGADPHGVKKARSDRVSEFMSYQLLHSIGTWVDETDTLLHAIPVVGCAFKKTYWAFERDNASSEMVSAFDLVVNSNTKDLESCPRITHVLPPMYPHEYMERVNAGVFIDAEIGEPEDGGEDSQAPHTFIEQHRRMDLDGDGYEEPYIVTVHKATENVVRIVANYRLENINHDNGQIISIPAAAYFTKVPFIPDPNGGFYDIGFGKLLEGISGTIDSALNQMMDAGHLQNAGGGFIGSGLRMRKDTLRQQPGVYHAVNAPGSAIKEAIVHIQHPGPSPVLFQLLGMMVDVGKEVASVSDVITGDVERNQTATTTLALIEQGLKVFTAIYKRIFRAMTKEFTLLYQLNHDYLDDEDYQAFCDVAASVVQDFNPNDMDICPNADPNEVTDMQRLGRAQLLMELSQDPAMNKRKIYERFLEAAGIRDIDELFIDQQGPNPMDEMQMEAMQADADKKRSEAEKNRAQTEKTQMDLIKGGVEAAQQGGELVATMLGGEPSNGNQQGRV